jgi:LAO/AO transport system kinase
MTDMFVLMQLPNAGDDLQAIKKGVMELADLVVVNKADINADAARRAQAQITSSLRLLGLHGPQEDAGLGAAWQPRVLPLSALHGSGIEAFWQTVDEFRKQQSASGRLAHRRRQQALAWMWERIDAGLKQAFQRQPQVRALLPRLTREVLDGLMPASTAARTLLAAAGGANPI